MIYLHKILPLFLLPINIILFLMAFGLYFRKRMLLLLAFLILLISSSSFIAESLVGYLEKGQNNKSIKDIKTADAALILGGMLIPIKSNQNEFYEWTDPDRFFAGIELLKTGKVRYLIFTDSKLPWHKNSLREVDLLTEKAINFGVKRNQILITAPVRNTEDEANATFNLMSELKLKNIILVTSAFHMSRASEIFQGKNIKFETFPVDFKIEAQNRKPEHYFFNANAFFMTQLFVNEIIGRSYYKIKKYLTVDF